MPNKNKNVPTQKHPTPILIALPPNLQTLNASDTSPIMSRHDSFKLKSHVYKIDPVRLTPIAKLVGFGKFRSSFVNCHSKIAIY